ncbi:MAG: hypothetical protein ACYS8Y_10600 [Planctomycetota bacterium]|jgi:hypothetical protein
MAHLIVLLIILGAVAYQFLKGTLVRAFAAIITTICASIIAFAYFESLAAVFVGVDFLAKLFAPEEGGGLTLWAQTISFVLLFIIAFAVLQTIAARLTRQQVDLGLLPERIGRVICGIILGLILSGLLITILVIAPLSQKWPYQRFDSKKPNIEKPNKILLNADGFVTGWFSFLSKGSFSSKRSFATIHPDFINQAFLTRHSIADNISIFSAFNEIAVPAKNSAWYAPEDLKDTTGKAVEPKSGHNLTIVRIGIKSIGLIRRKGAAFTPAQLRLICKPKTDAKNLAGKGKSIYPIGYLKTANQLQRKQLTEKIELARDDFDSDIRTTDFKGKAKWIDFAFYVPNDSVPVLAELKQNSIAQVPPPVTAEQAPVVIPFIQLSRCTREIATISPVPSAKVYGLELAAGNKLLSDLSLKISNKEQWQNAQAPSSIRPAQFDNGTITFTQAELKIETITEQVEQEDEEEEEEEEPDRRVFTPGEFTEKEEGITGILKPLEGYQLLSLKCNNPSGGAAIGGQQLPVLVELTGLIHHSIGVIAAGKIGQQTIYEVDYCSLTTDDVPGALQISEDGFVEKTFPDSVWLTNKAQSISEFYVLFLVKKGRNAVITSVRPGDSQITPTFKQHDGFLVK